ncbi:hypothetical protein ZIOFF_072923 [Zingiber officinale]|uniref:Mitochondrial ribosomal protein L37 n=1 Tax=Zingiber officinale TaxID=94328 RepID=A0A8J5ETK5_ZINOF|nr:hypothetical protein ZIOFF_072923 [Zingiber officinale]
MSCRRLMRSFIIPNKATLLVAIRGFAAGGKAKKGSKGGDAPKAAGLSKEVKSTTVYGANILKEGGDPKILLDAEYPDWLWHLLDKRPPLSELRRKDSETLPFEDLKRFVKLDNRAHAIKELQVLSQLRRCNREHMHNAGIKLLIFFCTNVRCEVMQFLRLLVEDEAGIGGTPGGILILISMKYNKEADPFSAAKAEETLKNLEKSPINIAGIQKLALVFDLEQQPKHWCPLPCPNSTVGSTSAMLCSRFSMPVPLSSLQQVRDLRGKGVALISESGSEEVQMEMVSYLGGIVLEDEMKTYVAERASTTLIQMINDGDTSIRREALRALVQISAHPPNCKILMAAGIMQTVVEEILPRRINSEPLDSPKEAAAILANILESDEEGSTEMKVSETRHTVVSHYFIYSIAQLIKSSIPEEASANLVRIFLSLAKLPYAMATVVSVVMEIGVMQTFVEFLNSELEALAVVAAKLLIALSARRSANRRA